MAASTPYRRTGCRVISVTRSGRAHESSIEMPSRTLRYSGSDRPAWRMNHTGVRPPGSRRQARRNGDAADVEGTDDGALVTASMLARSSGPPDRDEGHARERRRDAHQLHAAEPLV